MYKTIILFVTISALNFDRAYGLQGIQTWISLGLNSPFVEFQAGTEILSNISVSLNTTDGIESIGTNAMTTNTFSYAFEAIGNQTIQKQHLDMIKNQQKWTFSSNTKNATAAPPASQNKNVPTTLKVDQKKNSNQPDISDSTKMIMPLALKAATRVTTTTTTTTTKPPVLPDSSPNIDDLKRHILMLQSLTKNDESFQSKFVVFPHLQRPATDSVVTTIVPSTTSTTLAPSTAQLAIINRISSTTRRTTMPTRKLPIPSNSSKSTTTINKDETHKAEKITIIPQVFLQNDQTPMNDDSFDRADHDDDQIYKKSHRSMNDPKPIFLSSTYAQNQSFKSPKTNASNSNKKDKQLRRDMRRKCKKLPVEQRRNCTLAIQMTLKAPTTILSNTTRRYHEKRLNEAKTMQGLAQPYQNSQYINAILASSSNRNSFDNRNRANDDSTEREIEQQILQRTIRSHRRRNTPGAVSPAGGTGDQLVNSKAINASLKAEAIHMNPEQCYRLNALSHSQQKLCASHTQIMPAISRGARAAIQECQHQFRNRRWNCYTVNDNTVFGPITALGSPEMAFIHAMASAAATSFIARACRDGQLSTCGCSRSSKPRQLHSDWAWGGCGDDLDFGIKFAQQFIDVRENERKRLQRQVTITAPSSANRKQNNTAKSETINGSNSYNAPSSKAEHLLELQEKITKEILSTKLAESEMNLLQAKINHEIMNSNLFSLEHDQISEKTPQRSGSSKSQRNRYKSSASMKARSKMNIHNNEAGRRAIVKKSRITCKCHGVSGSCSLITCWQQLTTIREIGDYLREKYDEAVHVKLNKRGIIQAKDKKFKAPTPDDLVYLEESPDFCRNSKQLQWPGTHKRVCNKTSTGLDSCAILCCGRGYNTKEIVYIERCNCRFHWCCEVKCATCRRVVEVHTCK